MKSPGEKIGNDVWCDPPPEALQIILSMPKRREEILPYCGDIIGTNFTRACQFLEIIDLHLHDLRHDGISRLDEPIEKQPLALENFHVRGWTTLHDRFLERIASSLFGGHSISNVLLVMALTSRSPSMANAVTRLPPRRRISPRGSKGPERLRPVSSWSYRRAAAAASSPSAISPFGIDQAPSFLFR